jgi:hypothetical protein
VALYYGVLIALLLVLVGLVQPEWLKYLPLGGLEGLPNSTALSAEGAHVLDVFEGGLFYCRFDRGLQIRTRVHQPQELGNHRLVIIGCASVS